MRAQGAYHVEDLLDLRRFGFDERFAGGVHWRVLVAFAAAVLRCCRGRVHHGARAQQQQDDIAMPTTGSNVQG